VRDNPSHEDVEIETRSSDLAHISTTQVYTRLDFQHLAKAYDAAHPRAHRKTETD